MPTAHLLPHVAALIARDLAVPVGVGHVEMVQGCGLCLLQGQAPVLVGVGQLEHFTAEAAAVLRTGGDTLSAFGLTLRALLGALAADLELGLTDGAVAIGVEASEEAFTTAGTRPGWLVRGGTALGAGCPGRVELGPGQLAVTVGVQTSETLRRIHVALGPRRGTLRLLGSPACHARAAISSRRRHFRLGDCTIPVGIDAGELLLDTGGHFGPGLHFGCAGR